MIKNALFFSKLHKLKEGKEKKKNSTVYFIFILFIGCQTLYKK